MIPPAVLAAGVEAAGSMAASAVGLSSADKQMDFQRTMSNTAHQREVADLRAAGLNPMLSAMGGSGASQPSGSIVTPENPVKGITLNYVQSQLAREQVLKTRAETNLINENTRDSIIQQGLHSAMAANEAFRADQGENLVKAQIRQMIQNTTESAGRLSNLKLNMGTQVLENMIKQNDLEKSNATKAIYKIPVIGPLIGAAKEVFNK